MGKHSMEEDNMAEFRLRIVPSPWHATLERLSKPLPLEGGERVPNETLEFFSPLELVSYLEQTETRLQGLR